jgi:DNA end-binding protein Ku
MPPHSLGSATISFGLVSIPVKLYSATQAQNDISFNMVHKTCGTRVKQQYMCPTHGTVVSRDEIAKGYEFAKDRFVIFSPEELKALEEKATQTIEITEFIPQTKVDPIYFEKAYYLGPDKGGDKPYALLARAMQKAGRVALAKYAARGKQYLILLRPVEDALVMQQLHYEDEIRTLADVPTGDSKAVKDKELELALQLIDQITEKNFEPSKYKDDVKERVAAAIQRKVDGEDITVAHEEAPKAEIIDLMEALRASLGGEKGKAAERKAPKHAPREKEKTAAKGKSARR